MSASRLRNLAGELSALPDGEIERLRGCQKNSRTKTFGLTTSNLLPTR